MRRKRGEARVGAGLGKCRVKTRELNCTMVEAGRMVPLFQKAGEQRSCLNFVFFLLLVLMNPCFMYCYSLSRSL